MRSPSRPWPDLSTLYIRALAGPGCAFHGREAWRRPGKGDHGRRTKVGNGISEAWVFGFRGNEADVQCLRLDHHARDMAFDQLAVCKDGQRVFPYSCSCKVLADAVAHELFGLGSWHPSDAAGFGLAILQERLRDIIPVTRALLVRMRRRRRR